MKIALLTAILILVGCGQGQPAVEGVLLKEISFGFYGSWRRAIPLMRSCATWDKAVDPEAKCSSFTQNQPTENSYWLVKNWARPSDDFDNEPEIILTIADVARFIEMQQGEQYVWWYDELVEAKR